VFSSDLFKIHEFIKPFLCLSAQTFLNDSLFISLSLTMFLDT